MITITRRFAVSKNTIKEDCREFKLLEEAIEEAQTYLEYNPQIEERYIVEIVKVVRRDRTPIIVEDIYRGR